VTTPHPALSLPAWQRRRLIAAGLLRALIATAVLVAAYYLLPLDHLAGVPLGLSMTVALVVLIAVAGYEVRAIIRSPRPGVRAVEALATTIPLFLLLFAATYFAMSQSDPGNFNVHSLTRTDTLYFTVTVFTTVGFGDISAASQTARLLVTVQMILDLLVLGLAIRVFLGAVRYARSEHQAPQQDTS